MSDKKIIAVIGATGAQGGGLAKAILADPKGGFSLRAVTRNPESDKGKALAAAGAEVVAADLDDEASLRTAFEGAYGAFCVTNFWEHFSPEKETTQGRNLARAAGAAPWRGKMDVPRDRLDPSANGLCGARLSGGDSAAFVDRTGGCSDQWPA
jgi:uncharacterized protein YbjT (DUF2867 family)